VHKTQGLFGHANGSSFVNGVFTISPPVANWIVFCLFPKWPIQVSFSPMANWSILSFVLNGQLKVSISPRPIGRMFHQLLSQVVNWECQLSFIQQLSSKMFTSVIHCHLDCWECNLLREYQLSNCHPLFIQVVVGSVNCVYHL
jgi:hypothetical protein